MNKEVMEKILQKIKEYDRIMIFRHVRNDGDCVGASKGLKTILKLTYPEKEIYFYFIRAKLVSEEIEPTFHSEIKWLSPSKSSELEFCPADISAAEKLKGAF